MPPARRKSPLWVRALPSPQLHALAFSLRYRDQEQPLSDRQEWLWAACISELEYRHRSERTIWIRCSCELCIPPFPEPEAGE